MVLLLIIKRLKMMSKIKKFCKENSLKLNVLNRNYIVAKNITNKFDFEVLKGEKVFKVKLFSAKNKITWVNFRDECNYQTCRSSRFMRRYQTDEYDDKRIKTITVMRNYKLTENEIPILLMCPVSIYEIKHTYGSKSQYLMPGDKIGKFLFTNTTKFLEIMKKTP